MPAAPNPTDCVCALSGHCFACLAAGRRCSRPGCRAVRSDGVRCGAPRRAPAMPEPDLVDEPAMLVCRHSAPRSICPQCIRADIARIEDGPDSEPPPAPGSDCVRALDAHDAPAPAVDLVAALRASLAPADGPGARALAVALARPFDAPEHVPGAWKMPLEECRARAARVSSASRPARALSLDDLDPDERARFSVTQPRTLAPRSVSASRARGVA